jgi:hypothetical protein
MAVVLSSSHFAATRGQVPVALLQIFLVFFGARHMLVLILHSQPILLILQILSLPMLSPSTGVAFRTSTFTRSRIYLADRLVAAAEKMREEAGRKRIKRR